MPPGERYFTLIPGTYKKDEPSLTQVVVFCGRVGLKIGYLGGCDLINKTFLSREPSPVDGRVSQRDMKNEGDMT